MESTFNKLITNEEDLRAVLGYPTEIVTRKTIAYVDEIGRDFIKNSSFLTIASADLQGHFDVSPKGDPAGFVKILSDKLLAIPDRPGNRKADTFTNILQNPNVGLIFFIPGIKETLRVNGGAKIVTDDWVLELLSCEGKRPSLAIVVEVREVFMHCAKCIIRSGLWTTIDEPQERPIPSLAKSLVDHGKLAISYEELDSMIKNDEKTNLY